MASDITLLLEKAAHGDRAVEEQVFQALYSELHRLAALTMRRERENHTLQPTALVNEAYMKLVGQQGAVSWESRAHFLNAAARVMRNILIDHARTTQALKRPGSAQRVELEHNHPIQVNNPELLLTIDTALQRLEALDPRQARVVELRYFGGLSVEETAKVLGISEKTVKRDWSMARAWLESELRG